MQIKKLTFKYIVYFLLFFLVALVIWYGRGYFFDESPDAGRDAFYASNNRPISDETNAAVGLSGLNAPLNADPIKFGHDLIDHSFDIKNNSKPKVKNTLQFIGIAKEDIVDCSLPESVEIESKTCTKLSDVSKLIHKNEILLKRYTSLYHMHGWQNEVAGGGPNLININLLLAAKVKWLILNKNHDEAFITWRDNYVFISRVVAQENTMITRAIFLVLDGLSLASLENLLYTNPELASKYHQELGQLLQPQGLARYNIKNMLRADYHFFNSRLFNNENTKKTTHIEYMRNKLYRFHLDFLEKASMPEPTLSESHRLLVNRYNHSTIFTFLRAFLPHGLSHTLSHLIISGQAKCLLLVKSMHSKSAMINALNLRIKAQLQNISSGDMQVFLNNAGKEFNCPFTERPMAWDSAKKTIYCNDSEENRRVTEVRI